METIHHQSHGHELTLQEENFYHYCDGCCSGCFEAISDGSPAYVCEACRFGLHKSCAELPTEISHPLHSQHPLTLLSHPYPPLLCVRCRDLYCNFGFSCSLCSFNLDLKCALLKDDSLSPHEVLERDKKATIRHFCHKHELKLCNVSGCSSSCHCCEYGISDSAYCCRDCEFTIHESCSEIPQCVEQHPLHPQHRLRFCDIYEEFQEKHNPCDASGYLIQGFSLMCGSCQCFFHVPCVEATPRLLKHKCHKHNLFYFKDVNAETWFCDCCNLHLSGSYYGCVSCGIRLHLQCVPIPKIVEHKCHWHPLTLVDSIVEDDYSKGCYCDVCNRPLYLKHRVYKCEKCRFFAHIECIVSEDDISLEILSSLNLGFEDKAEQCNDRKENIDDTDGNRIVAIEDESDKTEESEEVQEADADAEKELNVMQKTVA